MNVSRRSFVLGASALGAMALLPTRSWWRSVFSPAPAVPGVGPYGPLLPPDANGIQLPVGFASRPVAVTGQAVSPSGHRWHSAPDGGGCFDRDGGGWIYVSNSEVPDQNGGVSAVAFDESGAIVDAYSLLSGTSWNCSGGVTPWGTWLSCEEKGPTGKVHECDPQRPSQGIVRPALGSFNHEAAAVDPLTGDVYLTEDMLDGRIYRFVPVTPGDLSAGELFAAAVDGATVTWIPTSPDEPDRQATTTAFAGPEGIHLGDRVVYFATKGDKRVWELDLETDTLTVAYDCLAHPSGSLDAVDNVTVHAPTGRVFIAEDGGNMELGVMAEVGGRREMAAFCRIPGHVGSEIAGPAFTPDGTRLYLSSQRGADGTTGVTYEITGPFAQTDPPPPPPIPVALPVTDDAYVRGGTFAATNFSTAWVHQVCNNSQEQYTRWTYLGADTAAVTGPLSSAVLRISARLWTGAPSPMGLYAVAAGWSESSLTWENRPSPEPDPVALFTIDSTSDQWYELDVTAHVNARRAMGLTAVAFVVRQLELNGKIAYVNSNRNPTEAPELVLTPAPATTTTTTPPTTTSTTTTTTAPPTTTTTTTTTPPSTTTTTIPPTTTTTTTSTTTTTTVPVTTTTTTVPPVGDPIVVGVDDAYVRGGSYASTNFSSTWVLHVCYNGRDQYTRWAYIAADIGVAGPTITRATLRVNARMSSGGPSPMSIHAVAPSWDSSTLTWQNRPLPGPVPLAEFVVVSTQNTWYDIDVTTHVASVAGAGGSRVAFIVRQLERNGKLGYINSGSSSKRSRLVLVT